MARNMVIKLGMSEKLGYVNYQESDDGQKSFSDETSTVSYNLMLERGH